MLNVVLVDDNPSLRRSLVDFLSICNNRVDEAGSAVELYQLLGRSRYDVAIVDVNLPHHDGFSVAEYLSTNHRCGIIMISVRDAAEDRVRGYRSGADIYMVKPVIPEELAAAAERLGAKARSRMQGADAPADSDWTYDGALRLLSAPNGRPVLLTSREGKLIAGMADAATDMFSRDTVLRLLDGEDTDSRGRLDVVMSRLRAKVRQATGIELPIVTAHTRGFALVARIRRT